jgi:hypothetical protein
MRRVSDAQLWIDLNREYPADYEPEQAPVAEIDLGAAPVYRKRPPEPDACLCFTCKSRPAGTPGWYEHSAYCSRCQLDMLNRLPQDKPVTASGREWSALLARCRSELETACSDLPIAADCGESPERFTQPLLGDETGVGADCSADEGNGIALAHKTLLHGPEGRENRSL